MVSLELGGNLGRITARVPVLATSAPVKRQSGNEQSLDPFSAPPNFPPIKRSSRFLRVLGDIANKGSLVLGLQTDILHLRKEPLNYDTPTSTSEPSPARPVAPHARPPCNGRPASTPEPSRTRSLRRASLESSVPRVARDRGLPARRPSRPRHRRGGRSTRSGSLVRLLSRRGLQGPSARFDAQDRLVRDPNRPSFA